MQTGALVYVYRREEMIKVLLHELIHALNMDSKEDLSAWEGSLKAYFAVDNPSLQMNEAFTDAMACYWNAEIYAVLTGEPLVKVLREERQHLFTQAQKVMAVYGRQRGPIHEETHALAYYVLKAAAWADMEDWKVWVQGHGGRFTDPRGFAERLERQILQPVSAFWRGVKKRVPDHHPASLKMSSKDTLFVGMKKGT